MSTKNILLFFGTIILIILIYIIVKNLYSSDKYKKSAIKLGADFADKDLSSAEVKQYVDGAFEMIECIGMTAFSPASALCLAKAGIPLLIKLFNSWNNNTTDDRNINTKSWRYIENNIILQASNEIYKDKIKKIDENMSYVLKTIVKDYPIKQQNLDVDGELCGNYCDFNIIDKVSGNKESSRVLLYNFLNNDLIRQKITGKGLYFFQELYTTMTRPDSLCQLLDCYIFSIQIMVSWFQELALIDPFIKPGSDKLNNPWLSSQLGNIDNIGKQQPFGTLLGEVQNHIISIVKIYKFTNQLIAKNLYLVSSHTTLPCVNKISLKYYDETIFSEQGYDYSYSRALNICNEKFSLTNHFVEPIEKILQIAGLSIPNWDNKKTLLYPKYRYVAGGMSDFNCHYTTQGGEPSIEKYDTPLNISYNENGGYPFNPFNSSYKDGLNCVLYKNCKASDNFYPSNKTPIDNLNICEKNPNLVKIKNFIQNTDSKLPDVYKDQSIYKNYKEPSCPINTEYSFTASANGLPPNEKYNRYLICQLNNNTNVFATECIEEQISTPSPTTLPPITTPAPEQTSPQPVRKNIIWAITDMMAIDSGAWGSNYENYINDDWFPLLPNIPSNLYLIDGYTIQDTNQGIGGPTIYMCVRYSQVDINSNIPILTKLLSGRSEKYTNTLCQGSGIKMIGNNEASVIAQNGGTSGKCSHYQAGCVYFVSANKTEEYITSVALTNTDNKGPILNLSVSIKNPNINNNTFDKYILDNNASLEDLHRSCGDSNSIYLVYSKTKISR